MIQYIKGDLFSTICDIIAHGCNAQGVMGSGVAKIVKHRYPEAFVGYTKFLTLTKMPLGKVNWVFCNDGKLLANCITQEKFGRDGKQYVNYEALKSCLRIVKNKAVKDDKTVALPWIGAGLGGGSPEIINDIMEEELSGIKLVQIYNL